MESASEQVLVNAAQLQQLIARNAQYKEQIQTLDQQLVEYQQAEDVRMNQMGDMQEKINISKQAVEKCEAQVRQLNELVQLKDAQLIKAQKQIVAYEQQHPGELLPDTFSALYGPKLENWTETDSQHLEMELSRLRI